MPKNILFLSTSEAYAHSVIKQEGGHRSIADRVLGELAAKAGARFTSSKDASLLNARDLADYDLVMFYTCGELDKPNMEGAPVMGEDGMAALSDWIQSGGGLIGLHATTYISEDPDPAPCPFVQILGAEFRTHGDEFEGVLEVVDPSHPAMSSIPTQWKLFEEWYLFKKLDVATMHVLAILDPGPERAKQELYNIPSCPIIWCSALGAGRCYFNALGHREDVWSNPVFQNSLLDAMGWAMGEGETQAEPNYDAVVPKEIG